MDTMSPEQKRQQEIRGEIKKLQNEAASLDVEILKKRGPHLEKWAREKFAGQYIMQKQNNIVIFIRDIEVRHNEIYFIGEFYGVEIHLHRMMFSHDKDTRIQFCSLSISQGEANKIFKSNYKITTAEEYDKIKMLYDHVVTASSNFKKNSH